MGINPTPTLAVVSRVPLAVMSRVALGVMSRVTLSVVSRITLVVMSRVTNGMADRKFIGWCVLLSVLFLGTAGTCLFPIELRFHYPYNWALTILAAETVVELMSRRHRL